MATLTSTGTSAGVQPKGSRVGTYVTMATYSSGSLSNGDVIQMVKVPAGALVADIKTSCLLSGQGSFNVGDGVSTARYIAGALASVSAGIAVMNAQGFVPYTYSTDDTIDIVYSASVNASTGAIYMIAEITLDPLAH